MTVTARRSSLCTRCRCCSLDRDGKCISSCEVDGHTSESIDAENQARFEEAQPYITKIGRLRSSLADDLEDINKWVRDGGAFPSLSPDVMDL